MAGDDGLEWLSDYLVTALKSPTWVLPIAEFVDSRCDIFDDEEENKFEYTVCHNDFKRLIEDLFMVHLLDVSVSAEQFQAFSQNGLSSKQALHHILCEQLLSVDDFLIFKAMMVKRNADLDRKAALALSAELAGRSDSGGFSQMTSSVEAAVSLYHDSGTVVFANWPMTNGVLAWHDRDFSYSGIPDELINALLFAGPHKDMPSGTLTFTSTQAASLYIFHENSGGHRDGGLPGRLKLLPEWVKVGGTQMKWGTIKGKDFWVSVWSRKVAAGATIDIPILAPFVGGVAVQADTGEWRLYEEQEQSMKGLSATGREQGATDIELQAAASFAEEADQRLEQAQLEQAIALSLQAEEERLRQIETLASQVEMPPPSILSEAPLYANTTIASEALAPLSPAPPPETFQAMPTPSPEAVEASRYEEPIPEAPRTSQAAKALNPVMPRMVRLKPLVGAPSVAPLAPLGASPGLDKMRADAVMRRERAERAMDTPTSPKGETTGNPTMLSAPAVSPQQPSEEERRLRAEHLKRQRALLMQKRKDEREQQLQAYQASRTADGQRSTAVDSAFASLATASTPGVVGATAGQVSQQPDAAGNAQKMRQALTLQLKQTLTSSVPTDS
eukprot:CAMPEP_0169087788 /NCGR_PEP_ID=MMETSP1015-20121227/14413_1 /TAXON_ID=342587 /ORGANISM="Karlodinium micrum, Strain CCMP2283" /LENGTH=615 /DNA_ID=CAMNT_0009148031 /DNA_START=45 /DNA_END=1888 /DNA_ORIENTATION=+